MMPNSSSKRFSSGMEMCSLNEVSLICGGGMADDCVDLVVGEITIKVFDDPLTGWCEIFLVDNSKQSNPQFFEDWIFINGEKDSP